MHAIDIFFKLIFKPNSFKKSLNLATPGSHFWPSTGQTEYITSTAKLTQELSFLNQLTRYEKAASVSEQISTDVFVYSKSVQRIFHAQRLIVLSQERKTAPVATFTVLVATAEQ